MQKKYPIGGYAPGNYQRRCYTCNEDFTGDSRATQCEACAIKDNEGNLTPEPVKFDSKWMIGRSKERFKELEHKGWDWRSFYNGWIEGRADAVMDVIRREQAVPKGAVWVKASEFKYEIGIAYHAKDSSSKGAGKFNRDGAFIWGDSTITWPKDREDLLILDESAGEKEVTNGMFAVTQIGGVCSNSNCPYCHGTGEIKVISETTSSISYYDCWGENGGLACHPNKTEFIDVMAFAKWRQENRWFDFDGTYWSYNFEHPTAISEKEYSKHYRKTTQQLYDLWDKYQKEVPHE